MIQEKGHVFILVPSDSPTGPVKGAYALANGISRVSGSRVAATLVFLKQGDGANHPVNEDVSKLYLNADIVGYLKARKTYIDALRSVERGKAVSLSMCLSADLFNLSLRAEAPAYTSVRGNLFENYSSDYGAVGYAVAFAHLWACRFFSKVFVLSEPMKNQVSKVIGTEPVVHRNFVDEGFLENFRITESAAESLRIVFVGSLTNRKRPELLVDALEKLRSGGLEASVTFMGEGDREEFIRQRAMQKKVLDWVEFSGFVDEPFQRASDFDVMVLPSSSEGTSRALMEFLYLGLPCVAFDVDGLSELIVEGENGYLVSKPDQLPKAIVDASKIVTVCEATGLRHNLLPRQFHQSCVIQAMLRDLNV